MVQSVKRSVPKRSGSSPDIDYTTLRPWLKSGCGPEKHLELHPNRSERSPGWNVVLLQWVTLTLQATRLMPLPSPKGREATQGWTSFQDTDAPSGAHPQNKTEPIDNLRYDFRSWHAWHVELSNLPLRSTILTLNLVVCCFAQNCSVLATWVSRLANNLCKPEDRCFTVPTVEELEEQEFSFTLYHYFVWMALLWYVMKGCYLRCALKTTVALAGPRAWKLSSWHKNVIVPQDKFARAEQVWVITNRGPGLKCVMHWFKILVCFFDGWYFICLQIHSETKSEGFFWAKEEKFYSALELMCWVSVTGIKCSFYTKSQQIKARSVRFAHKRNQSRLFCALRLQSNLLQILAGLRQQLLADFEFSLSPCSPNCPNALTPRLLQCRSMLKFVLSPVCARCVRVHSIWFQIWTRVVQHEPEIPNIAEFVLLDNTRRSFLPILSLHICLGFHSAAGADSFDGDVVNSESRMKAVQTLGQFPSCKRLLTRWPHRSFGKDHFGMNTRPKQPNGSWK